MAGPKTYRNSVLISKNELTKRAPTKSSDISTLILTISYAQISILAQTFVLSLSLPDLYMNVDL